MTGSRTGAGHIYKMRLEGALVVPESKECSKSKKEGKKKKKEVGKHGNQSREFPMDKSEKNVSKKSCIGI